MVFLSPAASHQALLFFLEKFLVEGDELLERHEFPILDDGEHQKYQEQKYNYETPKESLKL